MVVKHGMLRLPVNGEEIAVPPAAHLSCPNCGEVVLRYQDSKRLGEDAIAIYHKKHGLLSADEIRAIRERFRLTQADLARLLRLLSRPRSLKAAVGLAAETRTEAQCPQMPSSQGYMPKDTHNPLVLWLRYCAASWRGCLARVIVSFEVPAARSWQRWRRRHVAGAAAAAATMGPRRAFGSPISSR
jgi:hypothetical protein